jgi:hypothetical protein
MLVFSCPTETGNDLFVVMILFPLLEKHEGKKEMNLIIMLKEKKFMFSSSTIGRKLSKIF